MEQLTRLCHDGKLPVLNFDLDVKRFQGKHYPSAEHYGKPVKQDAMGRYNDLSGNTGVCYFAENSLTALAESYGRMYHHGNGHFAISGSSLEIAQIYTLHPLSPLRLVDMATLASMLHLTADQLTGADYTLTQIITGCLANDPLRDFHGIRYASRHYLAGMCLAVFEPQEGRLFETLACESLSRYTEHQFLPVGWPYQDITAEEMLVKILHFDVTL
ncbi:RES family NAD+ phosphorylase [Morganella morganii]|uniref:RES family NAD+ phosphorylase n=1 Tax=Morganella morganii TaxID=582 RepID=UPI001F1CE1EE|nr:RES family NAD+ phosphorylase [Morganella morganii]MCF1267360.1 RES family NAD+ phosphorylase [Morganella morganii]